jgi:hypothetical protein
MASAVLGQAAIDEHCATFTGRDVVVGVIIFHGFRSMQARDHEWEPAVAQVETER